MRAPREWAPDERDLDDLYSDDQKKVNTFTDEDHENVKVIGATDNRITFVVFFTCNVLIL